MLPFLKKSQEGGASAPVETIEREPDDGPQYGLLDSVVDDFMQAIEKKDKGLLKSALEAFKEHLQEEDENQDQQTMEGI